MREIEGRPTPDGALGPDTAAVALEDATDGGQPYPGALELLPRVQPLERTEQLVHEGGLGWPGTGANRGGVPVASGAWER